MTSPSTGSQNGVLTDKIDVIGAHRLGLKLVAGVFSVVASNGADLSNKNAGFLCLPNSSVKGTLKSYLINANQSFSDSTSGGSTIVGNLFGTASGDIWATDVPFYLYACIDDANTTPIFGVSRIPNLIQAPVAGNIGTPASATADLSYGMFLFSNVTIANYDLNPVVCLGSFRMQKITGDDWTVQAFNNSDGFGRFQENKTFAMPAGVNGNAAGAYFIDNTGTAPTFSANFFAYKISRDGMLWENALLFNPSLAGTAGVGTVTLTHNNVLTSDANVFGQNRSSGYGSYQNSPGNPSNGMAPTVSADSTIFHLNNNTTTYLNNDSFSGTAGYGIQWCTNVPVRTV